MGNDEEDGDVVGERVGVWDGKSVGASVPIVQNSFMFLKAILFELTGFLVTGGSHLNRKQHGRDFPEKLEGIVYPHKRIFQQLFLSLTHKTVK